VVEVLECEEFGVIALGVGRLLIGGEITIDSRIADRGYLNISLVKGQVVFRADRHVGLIPVNDRIAIRVRPRAQIANIAYMIVKSGVAPAAVPDFSRGYLPKFETGADAEKIYCGPLIGGVEKILDAGMMKSYVTVENPPAWRGRLMASDTIRKHRARNVRYKGEFDFKTLSYGGPENVALKHGLQVVLAWLTANDRKNEAVPRIHQALRLMAGIPDHTRDTAALVRHIGRSAARLPSHYAYYRDPLWTTYLLLQSKLPDMSAEGFVTLDSLIVDLSKVFEAFVRTVLLERAEKMGWQIVDGNTRSYPFFSDSNTFRVQPDIVIMRAGKPVAVLDVKYKPDPKESDRYEVLSFMDATGVACGGFVCPQKPGGTSRYMGVTSGGKRFSVLRFDLAAADIEAEASRFADNVQKLVDGIDGYA
jgi:hypothetical protein